MYESSNYWKLGLFVVLAMTLGVASLFWLGAGSLRDERPTLMVTYFNESVQGLSPGSEVKFRGVKIGEVDAIRVSDDTVHLEVICKIFGHSIKNIPLLSVDRSTAIPHPVKELRTQITSANLTGQKYVSVDVIEPGSRNGTAELPPDVRPPTDVELFVPARPSTLKSFENALNNALNLFDDVGPGVGSMVASLEELLRGAQEAELPSEARVAIQKLRGTLTEADTTVTILRERITAIDASRISSSSIDLLERGTSAVESLRVLIASISEPDAPETHLSRQVGELVRFATHEIETAELAKTTEYVRDGATAVIDAADSVGRAADQVALLTDDLELTLTSLRETIDAVRGLVLLLEHDPSSLLRGRNYGSPPPKLVPGN